MEAPLKMELHVKWELAFTKFGRRWQGEISGKIGINEINWPRVLFTKCLGNLEGGFVGGCWFLHDFQIFLCMKQTGSSNQRFDFYFIAIFNSPGLFSIMGRYMRHSKEICWLVDRIDRVVVRTDLFTI